MRRPPDVCPEPLLYRQPHSVFENRIVICVHLKYFVVQVPLSTHFIIIHERPLSYILLSPPPNRTPPIPLFVLP
ncbi:uncharacterized protein LAJ45_08567 [Morchella importuna]|uniref:uncharacterized protein n=1 Tax=Morchella importuna TaxID=1174673 RepID=UPI001E8EB536|nr:uncharacterized protein LAJ45_08567 [Morchella importuna]KAH8147411.1 hypothetical protein LAJ45_08567 [Morchella importuna]